MPLFLVLTNQTGQTPAVGQVIAAHVYLGNHGSADEAAAAGADALAVRDGSKSYVVNAGALTTYTNTVTTVRNVGTM